jgi:hypothetical protein
VPQVPFDGGDLGRQTGVVVEAVMQGDAAAVFEDLGAPGVFLGGDVAGLLQQRKIDV